MTHDTHVTATRREINVNVFIFAADIRNLRCQILKHVFLTKHISKY